MKNLILKKRVEPYILLETLKSNFEMEDLTFDGNNKATIKNKMLEKISSNPEKTFGLYMKNVNKFYVFSSSCILTEDVFTEKLGISKADLEFTTDINFSITSVDLAKAEASIIMA